ncbi:Deoxycytidylate deaminase [Senna tora]|uniref:dCMP deaminase n=1 Tax=Senna tora TaxID=362788 RepID=A0A834SVR4_9FABA|nr:Deoxycytidylate deaminase [Senna tora]
MVSTRMEGRVDTMETEMGGMKVEIAAIQVDITSIEEFMIEMKDSLGRLEGKNQEQDTGGSRLEGDREREKELQEEEGGGENREKRRGTHEEDGGAEKDNGRYRRLELPVFYGEDPIGWLFRVERYFSVNAVPGEEKLDAVAVCIEGKALNWMQLMEVRNSVQSWSGFKKELIRRFHQSQQGNGYEILMAHKQTHNVGEYRERFELLSAPLKEVSEEMLIGFYQSGLKEEVRAELRMTQAQSLMDVMDMSQKIEERNEVVDRMREEKLKKALKPIQLPKWSNGPWKPNFIKNTTSPSNVANSNTATTSKASEVKGSAEKKNSSTVSTPSKKSYCRLTDEEMKRKRELGECFTCDEKWSPAHQCKNKRINLITLLELEDEEDDEDEGCLETEREKDGNSAGTLMSLSLNSVVGITGGLTMKLLGKINGTEVLVMVDSGATHNFISTEFVEKLGLKVEKTKVTLGDGCCVQQEGKCRGLEVELQGLRAEERTVCLMGDVALAKSLVSMKNLIRSLRKGGNGFLLELNEVIAQVEPELELDDRIKDKRPIAYYSHVLSNRARQNSVYERELMAIVFAVKKWRHYLLGHKFVIKTDQKALKFLLEQRIMDPDKQKTGADMALKAFSVWQYDDLEDWDKEVQQDDKLTRIKQQLITDTAEVPGYSLRNGCLIFQNRYLPWDDYFMAIAFLSAERSKDPNRQIDGVGACLVCQDGIILGKLIQFCNQILGIGYNGFPRGCSDDKLPWAKKSRTGDPLETKYPYVCHAEVNAILNTNHASAAGQRLYVTMFPCNECAKIIIQLGVSEVIYFVEKRLENSNTAYIASHKLLSLAGVKVRKHQPLMNEIHIKFEELCFDDYFSD